MDFDGVFVTEVVIELTEGASELNTLVIGVVEESEALEVLGILPLFAGLFAILTILLPKFSRRPVGVVVVLV